MINLKDFNSAQEIINVKSPIRTNWIVAIDIGFSSVKGMSPNKRFCFPSYVRKIEETLMAVEEDDIYYRDFEGTYLVGTKAQDLVRASETNDTSSLFDRNRYFTKEFLILARVAMAIGFEDNNERRKHPQLKPFIQTGLPTAYLKEDAPKIKKTFSKPGKYEIKIGNKQWKKYENNIKFDDVKVMPQPSGTLNSIMIDNNGNYREDRKTMLSQNLLIADAGFGTFDPYGLVNREVVLKESIDNLGMKTILERASELIYKDQNVDIKISQMRKYMKAGFFKIVDIENMTNQKVMLEPYVEKASNAVAEEAAKKLWDMSGYFRDYDMLIMTGGTGAAWFEYFKEKFKDMEGLEIIAGNDGCPEIPIYYANVRGYYLSAFRRLKGES